MGHKHVYCFIILNEILQRQKQDVSVVIEGHFTPLWCIGIGKLRIKDVLSYLSQAVSEKRASELRHSVVASQDILFWTPHGQLL